jgi:hypothetical protein
MTRTRSWRVDWGGWKRWPLLESILKKVSWQRWCPGRGQRKAAATKRDKGNTACDVEDVQVRLSHVVGRQWREGESGRTYRWNVARGLVLLLSPSRSSPVVVSVSVPASDSVGVRASLKSRSRRATGNRRPHQQTNSIIRVSVSAVQR